MFGKFPRVRSENDFELPSDCDATNVDPFDGGPILSPDRRTQASLAHEINRVFSTPEEVSGRVFVDVLGLK